MCSVPFENVLIKMLVQIDNSKFNEPVREILSYVIINKPGIKDVARREADETSACSF